MADFNSTPFYDHIKFMLDVGEAEPVRRDYTPRGHALRYRPCDSALTFDQDQA